MSHPQRHLRGPRRAHAGLAAARHLLHATRGTTAGWTPEPILTAKIAEGRLDSDQGAAARAALESGRRVDALVGPAGTDKTTTMAPSRKPGMTAAEGGDLAGGDAWDGAGSQPSSN